MDEKKPHRLSDEVLEIIRNEDFQKTADKFARKNDTIFKVLKGTGFTIALISGLVGYLLKANSEADDRRAEAITRVIEEKKEWSKRVTEAMIDLRQTRNMIRIDCEHGRAPSEYDQAQVREKAVFKLVTAIAGVQEIFDEKIRNKLMDMIEFDRTVKNVCTKDAPSGTAWRQHQLAVGELMKDSIRDEREELAKLTQSWFSNFFRRF